MCELEDRAHKNGGELPETIYHQIDGGSENACNAWLAIAELIIAQRLTNVQKIFLTRLCVGHTHEDIDSKFALIWKYCRLLLIASPQMAKQFYWKALQSDKLPAVFVDLFAVPDYSDFLCDSVDPQFGRAFKQRDGVDWTQLQFIIERVPVSSEFPLGVKTTARFISVEYSCNFSYFAPLCLPCFRQFVQENVHLIIPKENVKDCHKELQKIFAQVQKVCAT